MSYLKLFTPFSLLTCYLLLSSSCAQKENPNRSMSNDLVYSGYQQVTDTATLGAGCFWCVEAVFQQLNGVLKVSSGYSGGHVANPTYEQVSEKNTGHAEVIQVVFDPSMVTFDEILEVFWQTHDPTTPNKQGNDVGPQYRSAIFYHNEEQKKKSLYYKEQLEKSNAWEKPIVTEISPFKAFYVAEDYHQNYYLNNGSQPYCYFVIRPKLEKFEKVFREKLKRYNQGQTKN